MMPNADENPLITYIRQKPIQLKYYILYLTKFKYMHVRRTYIYVRMYINMYNVHKCQEKTTHVQMKTTIVQYTATITMYKEKEICETNEKKNVYFSN